MFSRSSFAFLVSLHIFPFFEILFCCRLLAEVGSGNRSRRGIQRKIDELEDLCEPSWSRVNDMTVLYKQFPAPTLLHYLITNGEILFVRVGLFVDILFRIESCRGTLSRFEGYATRAEPYALTCSYAHMYIYMSPVRFIYF